MDATIASTSTFGWELLAELARCGQQGLAAADAVSYTRSLAELLGRYLPGEHGRLEVVAEGAVVAAADWGEGELAEDEPLRLSADGEEIGRLLLSPPGLKSLEPNFAVALAAQLSLLLLTRRRTEENALAAQVRDLVASNLELIGVLDLRSMLGATLTRSLALVGFESGAIYEAAEGDSKLTLIARSDGSPAFPASLPATGDGLAARAVGTQAPAEGGLALSAQRRRGGNGANNGERPALALPLLAHEKVSGVLVLLPAAQASPTQRMRRLGAALAEQVALLVRNARQFSQQQQRARELFVLYENSQEINSTTQIESMLDRATENIALALQADFCAVKLIEPGDPDTLRTVSVYHDQAHEDHSGDSSLSGAGAILAQLGRGDAMVIEDVAAIAGQNPLAAVLLANGCHSAMVLPLRAKDETLGLLAVGFAKAQRGIVGAERNLAQVLANQVATAITNRRLYLAEQQRAAELGLLQLISQQLTADLSIDETLDSILEGAQALAHFGGARIMLYEPRSRSLGLATSMGLASPDAGEGLSSWLARRQRPLRIADLQQPPADLGDLGDLGALTLEDGAPARAYLGVPMRLGDELVGTLELMAARPNAFGADNERLLSIIAGQSAQAIANATRFKEADASLRSRHEQLRALQRVSSQLAITLDQKEILAYVLEQALKATGASHGLIALRAVQEEGGDSQVALSALGGQQAPEIYRKSLASSTSPDAASYQVIEAVGYADPDRSRLLSSLLPAEAITAQRALLRKEPELSDRLADPERSAVRCDEARSALAAPIFYQAGVYGVLLLLSHEESGFDHDAVEFLRALTHQAAVGIGNAQRYVELENLSRTLQRRAAILNDVLEIGQALRVDRNLENLLEQVGYSAMESANYRTILFVLADPDSPHTLKPQAAAGIPLSELDRMSQSPLPMALATRYLDPRFRIGRSYFVPAEEAHELEQGFTTEIFSYSPFDDERAPGEWQHDDRLCVPLYSTEGTMLGLMFVGDPHDRQRPTPRAVEPLEIFADQAAIAIENHYLLRDARARAEQMAALYQVGTAAGSSIELDTLLERVYQEIVAYLGIPSFFYIASYRPERQEVRFELFMRQGEIMPSTHKAVAKKDGLTGLIIDSGKPLLVADLQSQPEYASQAVRRADSAGQVRSWLGVPLISQSQVIGVLSVQDFAPNAFTERDLQFLSALANQLAIALENARLFREREQRLAELNVIYRIGQITSSTLDLQQMLRSVYSQLADFLTLDSFYIFLYNEESNEVVLCYEVDEGYEEMDTNPRQPGSGTMTARIIETRQPLQFDNLAEEHTAQGFKPVMFGSERRSAAWLGVPLLVGDSSVVGVMAVMSYTPALYGERERSFLTTVASQMALGVQNARLLARAREQVVQLALLNRVSVQTNAATDVRETYQIIVDAMAQATGVDQARLVIYDRPAGVAPAVAEHVPSGILDQIAVPIANSPSVEWLDKHQRPLISEDAQNDPLFTLSHETFRELDIRSIALVPLIVDGQVIGAVGLDFVGRNGVFRPQAIELCQTIAHQTSTAIARGQAFAAARASAEALGQKVGELTTLLDAARILSSLLRPQEVLNKLMELVSRQLNVTTVALWTIEGDVLTPAALDGIPAERGRSMRVPIGQGHTGKVAATGQPLIIDDVREAGGSLYPAYEKANNLVSYMGVPVVYRERTIGVLSVMTSYQRQFSDDEMLLLVGLADQAAAALENARLFEERERRINELSTINKISQGVNASLDEQDLLEKLHHGISEIIDVGTSLIGIYDEASDTLRYPVAYDNGRRVALPTRPLLGGTNGWAIRNRQPLLISSAADAREMGLDIDDGRVGLEGAVEESYLVAPIVFGNQVLGVINIQSYERQAFDENDLRFLTTVANQAAVALNNARLFSETRQNAEEMSTLFEVTQNLSGTLDPDETQMLVADAALRLINAELCAVLRFDRRGRIDRQVLADLSGLRDDFEIDFRNDGMSRRLLQTDHPLAVTDLSTVPDANPQVLELGVRSAMGTVIGSHDEQLGVIWVGARRPHEWSEHQRSLLSILANQAGQALKSAQLFQLEQQRRRLADTLRDVAQSFTSTLALREIQTLILDQLGRVVEYDSAAVLLRDEGYGHLQITEARGITERSLLDADFEVEDNALFQLMALERQPLLIEDTLVDPRFAPMLRLGWSARSWIGAPLLVDNELVGILTIGAAAPGAYDAEAVEVTFALASQASQAIQNARLFDQISNLAADLERRVSERTAELEQATRQLSEEKDRLEAVHAITLELTTQLDLNSIILRALAQISKNLGVGRGSIMLRDPETGQLVCRAVLYDRGDVRPANIPLTFNGGTGLSDWVMQHQEPVNIPDVLKDPRWVQEQGRAEDVRSAAGVPLKTSDTAVGVLILSSPEVGYFSDSQMNLLGTIASVVAAAVSNAQLYNFITELATRNSALLEEQREESSKSAAVFRSVTEGVIVLDPQQQVTLFNPAAEQVLEIEAAEVLGQPLARLGEHGTTEVERKRAQTIYNGLLNGLKQVRQSQRIYSTSIDLTDPTQVIAVNMAQVIGPRGERYGDVAVLRDITREIEADQEKRQFISDVSHELRTPLTAIKGYVDVLLLSGASSLSEDQASYLGIIKNNTNRLKALIEDILEFSRPDSKQKLNFTQVEIPSVIDEVVQSLRLEAERKDMTVTVDAPAKLPAVTADQKRITQVVFNLFSNAVKYTYEGGRIQVRAFLNRANMMQVEVEDSGVGMSPDQIKRLFRPFYRADNPLRDVAGGTGLGLSIAKSFVEMHGGEMWVTSELGKGSTFSFIIPLHQSEANDADEDPE